MASGVSGTSPGAGSGLSVRRVLFPNRVASRWRSCASQYSHSEDPITEPQFEFHGEVAGCFGVAVNAYRKHDVDELACGHSVPERVQ